MKYRYPQRPVSVNKRLIQPTKEFRREVIGVVKSIVAFIFTYIFLVIAGAAFACLCAFVGYWIVTMVKNLWGIVFGIGCVGLGVMVLFFLLKFVFKSSSVDRSNMLEVTAKEQPVLFQFIRQLAAETETR